MNIAKRQDGGQWQHGFKLICLCLAKDVDNRIICDAISKIELWDLFLQQVTWHRVAARLWRRLAALAAHLPNEVVSSLKSDAHRIALAGMRHCQELRRLGIQFQHHRIDFLVLKGVPLSHQLYGDVGIRFSRDLDILVKEGDIDRAHELLSAMGYTRIVPHESLPASARRYFRKFYKDFTYRHVDSGIVLELHWRLGDNPHLLPLRLFLPFQYSRLYDMPGMNVPVLTAEHNALYLMLHAAKASWARLSWVSDISCLMQAPIDWRGVFILARQHGLTDVSWVSLQVAHRLLGAPVPAAFAEEGYTPTPVARCLLAQAEKCLLKASYPDDITYYFQDLFLSGRPQYISYQLFYRGAFSLNDIALVPLPRYLFFMYLPLRPLLWVWRRYLSRHKDHVGFQR